MIVALRFQFSDQAGWECASCRKAGLEQKRRCGWLAETNDAAARVVWASHDAAIQTCPKSFITAQSLAWMEEYLILRKLGVRRLEQMDARKAEAFLVLENELVREMNEKACQATYSKRS